MSAPRARMPLTIVAFALAQAMCWGMTFNLPAITGTAMAASLGLPYAAVMAGPTAMLVAMALAAMPFLRLFERIGARQVMTASVGLGAAGLAIIGISSSGWWYFGGWVVVGLAGAGMLTTAMQIGVAELAGERARQAVGALLLFGGLAQTICWPLLGFLQEHFGWRGATLIGAAIMALVSAPIYWLLLARRPATAVKRADTGPAPPLDRIAFALLAISGAANGIVTWGLHLTVITLFEQRGVVHGTAVFIASFLGIAALLARLIEFAGGQRWRSLTTALVAGAAMPPSFAILFLATGTPAAIAFIAVYGLSAGALAVVRSTLPLELFAAAAYARASSMLALPLNLSFACAPPLFAALLDGPGSDAALWVATGLSLTALISIVMLATRYRQAPAAAP